MQDKRKKSGFRRLGLSLRGREIASPATAIATAQGNQTSQVVNKDYNDRQRSQIRYKEAAKELKEAIKVRNSLGSFDFEELSGEPESFNDSQFKNKINTMLISRETSIKDRKGWSKFKNTVECVFTALSPFSKNLLIISRDAQWVTLLALCNAFSY